MLEPEDRRLIRAETTTVVTRDRRKRNGTLRYHIRPIRKAVDHYHERQLCQLELDTERQKAQARLSRLCAAQKPPLSAGPPNPQQWKAACQGCAVRRAERVTSAIFKAVR